MGEMHKIIIFFSTWLGVRVMGTDETVMGNHPPVADTGTVYN